eukprot:jgi/Botrbrau1/7947/Bobra.9_2s0105.1
MCLVYSYFAANCFLGELNKLLIVTAAKVVQVLTQKGLDDNIDDVMPYGYRVSQRKHDPPPLQSSEVVAVPKLCVLEPGALRLLIRIHMAQLQQIAWQAMCKNACQPRLL